MKKYFKKLALLFTVSLLLIVSCSKDDKSNPSENSLTTAIITPMGGSVETNEGIKIIFPTNAVSEDTEVAVGYAGTEPTTFPNSNFQMLGSAFTVKIAANNLNQSALLEIPKPAGYTNIDQTVILISKQGTDTYYPLFFHENGGKLIAELDDINYTELYPALRSNADVEGLFTTLIVYIVKNTQTPPINEMGLKKVDVSGADNIMTFNAIPILNSSDKVLVMVHGVKSSPSSAWKDFLSKIKPLIECAGYTHYLTFGYYSGLGIDENSIILANLLQTKMNGATVDIIGHSMGGLVSRSAIEDHNCSNIVRNLITLGTPHKGSSAANLRTLLGILLSNNLFATDNDFSVNTQGFRDLIPASTFLTNLNNNPAPTTDYYPIAGMFNNTLEFDGVVTKVSALGIQNNLNLTKGKAYVLTGTFPHITMTENDTIIKYVAKKLNDYNNSPATCNECDDTNTSYPTVSIGSQIWMEKNLNVCKYLNGDNIPQVQNPSAWATLTTGAWCYNQNNSANGPVYGKLYNWYAVNDPRGLAPEGYHVPTDEEWTTLITFLGGETVAGGKLKSTTGWSSPNYVSNSSGFSALPGGSRWQSGSFHDLTFVGSWWSASQVDFYSSPYNWLHGPSFEIYRTSNFKSDGHSVRCMKN